MTTNYFSYLLRFWQSENQNENDWYASLEETKSRQIIYFKNLDQMVGFLKTIQTQSNNPINDIDDLKNISIFNGESK